MSTPNYKINIADTLSSDSLCHTTLDWTGNTEFPLAKLKKVILVTPSGPKLTLTPGQKLTVGRTLASEHSVPNDHLMSRRHFTIECESGIAILKDLQSTNGTFLNGKRVQEVNLSDRDRIIAGLTTFIVRLIA